MVSFQRLFARFLIGLVAIAGLYYTIWVVILPFVDSGHHMQNYFPPRRYAIVVPSILMVFGIGILGIWVSIVLLRERVDETFVEKQKHRRISNVSEDKVKMQ